LQPIRSESNNVPHYKIGKLNFLEKFFGKIYIPWGVYNQVMVFFLISHPDQENHKNHFAPLAARQMIFLIFPPQKIRKNKKFSVISANSARDNKMEVMHVLHERPPLGCY